MITFLLLQKAAGDDDRLNDHLVTGIDCYSGYLQ